MKIFLDENLFGVVPQINAEQRSADLR